MLEKKLFLWASSKCWLNNCIKMNKFSPQPAALALAELLVLARRSTTQIAPRATCCRERAELAALEDAFAADGLGGAGQVDYKVIDRRKQVAQSVSGGRQVRLRGICRAARGSGRPAAGEAAAARSERHRRFLFLARPVNQAGHRLRLKTVISAGRDSLPAPDCRAHEIFIHRFGRESYGENNQLRVAQPLAPAGQQVAASAAVADGAEDVGRTNQSAANRQQTGRVFMAPGEGDLLPHPAEDGGGVDKEEEEEEEEEVGSSSADAIQLAEIMFYGLLAAVASCRPLVAFVLIALFLLPSARPPSRSRSSAYLLRADNLFVVLRPASGRRRLAPEPSEPIGR